MRFTCLWGDCGSGDLNHVAAWRVGEAGEGTYKSVIEVKSNEWTGLSVTSGLAF